VEPHCEVSVLEVKEHSKVARDDHFRDELDAIHPKSGLPLKIVEFPIIGAEAECAVLLGTVKMGDSKSRNAKPAAQRRCCATWR
jgi:hypothetical protein